MKNIPFNKSFASRHLPKVPSLACLNQCCLAAWKWRIVTYILTIDIPCYRWIVISNEPFCLSEIKIKHWMVWTCSLLARDAGRYECNWIEAFAYVGICKHASCHGKIARIELTICSLLSNIHQNWISSVYSISTFQYEMRCNIFQVFETAHGFKTTQVLE